MYSVLNYGHMVADAVRMDAYARAIERTVKPGSIVVDIGAGTGIFSLLAARAGARRVHAIEPNPAVWLLADLARENGVADRVEIHQTTSYDVTLPEKADVIVSDLRGSIPLHGEHLAVLRDAKARLLAPNGVLLPQRDDLVVGVIENDELEAWMDRGSVGFERYGWKRDTIRRSILNTPVSDGGKLRANDLVTTADRWTTLDYGSARGPIEGEVNLVARRRATAHALAVWFAATIFQDLGFATEPGTSMVYSRLLLPLSEPIALDPDDGVHLVLRADEQAQRWAWETTVTRPDATVKARLRQSSFFGMPTSPEALLRASSSYTPSTSPSGARARRVLELMDGKTSIADIAAALSDSKPATLPDAALLEEVRDLAARYGR